MAWAFKPGAPDNAFTTAMKRTARSQPGRVHVDDHILERIVNVSPMSKPYISRDTLRKDLRKLVIKAKRPGERIQDLGAYVRTARL